MIIFKEKDMVLMILQMEINFLDIIEEIKEILMEYIFGNLIELMVF